MIFLLQERQGQQLRSFPLRVPLASMDSLEGEGAEAEPHIRAEDLEPLEHHTLAVQAEEEVQHLLLAVLPQQTGEQEATGRLVLQGTANRVAAAGAAGQEGEASSYIMGEHCQTSEPFEQMGEVADQEETTTTTTGETIITTAAAAAEQEIPEDPGQPTGGPAAHTVQQDLLERAVFWQSLSRET